MTLAAPGATSPRQSDAQAGRWPVIDVLRGGALVAMVIYHLVWDLSFFALIDRETASRPEWRALANAIAATFLMAVGAGIALDGRFAFDGRRVARRLAVIAGAAALVTAATLYAMPDAPVWFGILHCIALSSLLALPLRRASPGIVFGLAIALLLAAQVNAGGIAALDHPALLWLGLGTRVPTSIDYVPLFPWFLWVLNGLGLIRLLLSEPRLASVRHWSERWRASAPGVRHLAQLGRWTLPIYLLHQPVLMGALFLVAQAARPPVDAQTQSFLTECRRSCEASGGNAAGCDALCGCVATSLKRDNLWDRTLAQSASGRTDPALQDGIAAIISQCRR